MSVFRSNIWRRSVKSLAIGVIGLTPTVGFMTSAWAQDGQKPIVGPPMLEVPEAERPAPASEPQAPLNLRKPAEGSPLELRATSEGIGWGPKVGLVAVAFAGAYLLYRRKNGARGILPTGPMARVVGRTSIGGRSSLMVVEIDGQRLLVGVTPSSLTTLTVLSDEPKVGAHEIDDELREPQSEREATRDTGRVSTRESMIRETSMNRESAARDGASGFREPAPFRDHMREFGGGRETSTQRDPEANPLRFPPRESNSVSRDKSGFAPSSKSSDMEESLNRLLASARAESEERTPRFSAVSSNSQPTSLAAKRNRARDYGQLEGQVRGLGAKRGA